MPKGGHPVRILYMLSAIIPGLPLLLHGRYSPGLLLFLFGTASWTLHAASHLRVGGDRHLFLVISLLAGISCSLATLIWTYHWTSNERIEQTKQRVEAALDEAQRSYLRGRLDQARTSLDQGLKHDSRDIDLLFLDWQVARRMGDDPRARRSRRMLRKYDLEEKWLWEVQREELVRGR